MHFPHLLLIYLRPTLAQFPQSPESVIVNPGPDQSSTEISFLMIWKRCFPFLTQLFLIYAKLGMAQAVDRLVYEKCFSGQKQTTFTN